MELFGKGQRGRERGRGADALHVHPELGAFPADVEVGVAAAGRRSLDVDGAAAFEELAGQDSLCHGAEEEVLSPHGVVEGLREPPHLSSGHSPAAVSLRRGHPAEDLLTESSDVDG
jgi:hypothetical protein